MTEAGAPAFPTHMRLVEVGLRDGLQAVERPIATSAKVDIVHGLLGAGVREIEAVSFARPEVLPQLADAEQVMAQVPRGNGAIYRGLVPNLRGAKRAVECGLDEIVLVISADEEVSVRNQRRSVTQMLDELVAVAELASQVHAKLIVGVACAFFAPARGPVTPAEADRVIDAAVQAGASGVYLAGTSGMEHPGEFANGVRRVRARHPKLEVGVHLHDRNGFAMANAVAAMGASADWLEGSFAGLGGDMWFPGDPRVLGNAATEDLVHLCESMGVQTGVDLAAYLEVVRLVESLTGWPSTSHVTRGGTRHQLASASWPE